VKKVTTNIFAFILIIILMSGMISFNVSATSATVTIAEADPVATIQARINSAIATGAATITVDGSKITANSTLTMTIPDGVTVIWNAVYKGVANPVIDYYGAGTLNIGPNGWVQNTSTPNSYTTIRANGNNLVVSGGTVQSGKGRAIEGAGLNTIISVTGGTVLNEATNNLFPVIDMTNANNTSRNVIVSGGELLATPIGASAFGYVIQSYGDVAVSGGTLTTTGVYGRVVNLVGYTSNLTVSGGIVQATGISGVAISTSTTLPPAQVINTSVTITGGFVASYGIAANAWAIHTTGANSKVNVSGGTVFSYGNSINGSSNSVVYTQGNAFGTGAFTGATDSGVVIVWNRPAWVTSINANPDYVYFTPPSTQIDILTSPAGAQATTTWGKRNPSANRPFDGIDYNYNGNTGFIPLPEVTVVDEYYNVSITFGPGLDPGCYVSSGSYPSITSYTPIRVRYNESLSFTVHPAATNYVFAVDTWFPPAGSQYFSELLFAGNTPGEPFTDTIQNVVRNQVIRVFFARPGSMPQYNIVAFADVGGSFNPSGFSTVPQNSNRTYTVAAQTGFYINEVVVDGHPVTATLDNAVPRPGTQGLQSGTYTFDNISRNHVITATFVRMDFNITATAGVGGSISPPGNTIVPYGDNQTFSITPDEGYFIEEVLIDGVPALTTEEQVFSNVTSNHTISVTFAQNANPEVYAFSAISEIGGTVTGTESGYYEEGTPINVVATANSGYHFTGWIIEVADTTDSIDSNPAEFSMPPNTVVLTATFEANPPDTYTLNVIGGEGGTVSGTPSGPYRAGELINVIAEANSGFHFTGWTIIGAQIIGGEFAKPAIFNMPANAVTLTATFERNPPERFTLNVIGGEGGTVSGTLSGSYEEGTLINVTAIANSGFHFTGWTITGAQIVGGEFAKPAIFNMPANAVTLIANFEPNPPGTFTLNVIGGVGGILSGTRSGAYVEGHAVRVTATASTGYRFIGWTITGATIAGGNNTNPAEFIMPQNAVTLTAVFEFVGIPSPQTGINRNIILPLFLLALGAIVVTGAELYRRRIKRKQNKCCRS